MTAVRKPHADRPDRSPEAIARRREAFIDAAHDARLAGLPMEVRPEVKAICDRIIEGELTVDEAADALDALYGFDRNR